MKRKNNKFIIKDWAGNVMSENGKFYSARSPWLHPKLFPDFEDAWGYLFELFDHLPEEEFDEQMGEFYVEEVTNG